MIWKLKPSLEQLNEFSRDTMSDTLGIEFTQIGDDFISARMPVDAHTRQPYGILHGGASATLAESLGSIAGAFCVDMEKKIVVGLELNCNHVRSVREGYVYGTARSIHLGGMTQIWDIRIVDGSERLVCIARLTLAVLDAK
jgi:1,4-dihydroxy-2-naphthoyl-CoA hydrolase